MTDAPHLVQNFAFACNVAPQFLQTMAFISSSEWVCIGCLFASGVVSRESVLGVLQTRQNS
jgi:hypothetical protein